MGKGKLFELLENRDYIIAVRDVREALCEAKREFVYGGKDFNGLVGWLRKYFGDE